VFYFFNIIKITKNRLSFNKSAIVIKKKQQKQQQRSCIYNYFKFYKQCSTLLLLFSNLFFSSFRKQIVDYLLHKAM
jgi:hypothetical protein